MKIKDIEVDFDFLDADDMEKFEKETQKLLERCNEEEKRKYSASEVIKVQCRIIEDFLNNVFGGNIAEKIFEKRNNLTEHFEIYNLLIAERDKQKEKFENNFKRYTPNRVERRYNKYKKRNDRGKRY